MSKAIIIKVIGLSGLLIVVIFSMRSLSTPEFKSGLNEYLVPNLKTISWCPDHVVDTSWGSQSLSLKFINKWKDIKPDIVKNAFCTISYDTEIQTNLDGIQFQPLLHVQSAEAKTATLEWSPESKLYRVKGLVFKSSILSRELLDEAN